MRPLRRVIAKLEIKGPNVIKGLQLEGNRVLGRAEHFAASYYAEGIDELFYQDAVASVYRRNSLLEVIRDTARKIFIPLTIGGGIRTVEDIRAILRAGADKVAINTAAVERPKLLSEGAQAFGSQCIVSSIEYFWTGSRHEVWTDFGRERTTIDPFDWARRVVDLGAGEILLTSIDRDGMGRGYDIDMIRRISEAVPVPVIASGGARTAADLASAIIEGKADAVCAASIFHYHYLQPITAPTLNFHKRNLRMGAHIDSGNIEFIRDGYGGSRDIMVEPTSIARAKATLRAAGIRIRDTRNSS